MSWVTVRCSPGALFKFLVLVSCWAGGKYDLNELMKNLVSLFTTGNGGVSETAQLNKLLSYKILSFKNKSNLHSFSQITPSESLS